ncbi:MAG TPA: NADH-quinone oxidoreductase subunit N [Armatimonadota bacterium]|nr:NADH-quinone oxidoreductase subunit N [Armatimonadota bacterium]
MPDFGLLSPIAAMPMAILSVAALVALVGGTLGRRGPAIARISSMVGLALTAAGLASLWADRGSRALLAFTDTLVLDNFGVFASAAFLLGAVFAVLLGDAYLRDHARLAGEYHGLVLLATVGMIAMAMASDLVVAFLGLELLSIPLYILAGLSARDARSNEASLKYLLLGAFGSGFLLFGIALLFGATGTTLLSDMVGDPRLRMALSPANLYFAAGAAMLLVGIGFKAGLVPFHMWVPDVYQGAPTPVSAFMATGPKAAAFVLLFRVFGQAFAGAAEQWTGILWAMAVATMTVANLAALRQTELKRLLAYSSISHAGTILLAVLAAPKDRAGSAQALLFYVVAYALMKAGAFGVVVWLQRQQEGDVSIASLRGLASRQPGMALAMGVLMFSLAGVPPMAGFWAKAWVFSEALQAGFLGLTILAVINSVVAARYYLRVVVAMYMEEAGAADQPTAEPSGCPSAIAAIWLAAALTVLIGLVPGLVFVLGGQAGAMLR